MTTDTIVHLTDASFDTTLAERTETVIVDFWAEWCGPCKAIAPVLEELAKEYVGKVTIAKVNVDEQPGLAARFQVRSIPTLLFFKGGRVVDQVIGAVPKAQIKKRLDTVA
jgi:thioredoxin 1